jgi:hypothetical protein
MQEVSHINNSEEWWYTTEEHQQSKKAYIQNHIQVPLYLDV